MINGSFLNWEEVTSRIPQYSVLGPVVFNIFINDLDEEVQEMTVKFVDDTTLGGTANTLEIRNKIQNYLDRQEHWAENNRMKFSRDKCKYSIAEKETNAQLQDEGYLAQQYY